MSAIWGFISLEKDREKLNNRTDICLKQMLEPYRECAIDRYEEQAFDNGFFACGIQYFTEESEKEKLPIKDEKRGLIFTGDIILNARDELVSELEYELSDADVDGLKCEIFGETDAGEYATLRMWPDGALTYAAYILWKEHFVDHIQGLFAIAVYDIRNNKFSLFTDHMGCRCIYYSLCGKELFFSSLCRPITDSMPSEYFGICEKFIAGAEYSNTPAMLLFPGLSPFENIFQLVRGNYLVAENDNGIFKEQIVEYYNPAKNKEQRMKLQIPADEPDKYCRETFRRIFRECVKDALRSKGEIAAEISSGLDSTSIAAVAATLLAKDNRKLHTYTSVPIEDYVNTTYDPCYITDESEGVKRFCEYYENIEPEFLRCEGKSAFTDMDELIRKFEVPGKALINQVWIMEIMNRMNENGYKVLLNGQYGNFTLSAGNAFSRSFQELFNGNIKEAKRQLATFGRRYSVPRKVLFRTYIGEMFTRALFALNLDKGYNSTFDDFYLKEELFKRYRIKDAERKLYKYQGYTNCEPRYKQNNAVMNATLSGTMGIYDTKVSIYYGIISRDPTRDKRMVDLCMALPNFAFAEDGLERRLVREYLDDMVPDSIRNDPGHRGVQSPDATLRLQRYGTDRKLVKICPKLYEYMNENNVKELLNADITDENRADIVRILALDEFLKEFAKDA